MEVVHPAFEGIPCLCVLEPRKQLLLCDDRREFEVHSQENQVVTPLLDLRATRERTVASRRSVKQQMPTLEGGSNGCGFFLGAKSLNPKHVNASLEICVTTFDRSFQPFREKCIG